MNVDENKLKLLLASLDSSFNARVEKNINECEIKPVNCDDCVTGKRECVFCENNKDLKNKFKPKQNELDNLFVGAPVMSRTCVKGSNYEQFIYTGSLKFYVQNGENVKLPSVEESPRNVWLAKWLNPPVLKGLNILIRFNDGKVYQGPLYSYYSSSWQSVKSIMILEDLKK